jgi:hypothetical protein
MRGDMARYKNIERERELLLPPNMRERDPGDHLVHFEMDAVDLLDVRDEEVNERGTGREQYPSLLMLCLLVYSYATGTYSSRQIERSS